jgi:hypothetical protein
LSVRSDIKLLLFAVAVWPSLLLLLLAVDLAVPVAAGVCLVRLVRSCPFIS